MPEPTEAKPTDPKDEAETEAEELPPPPVESIPQRPRTTGAVAPGIFWTPGSGRR